MGSLHLQEDGYSQETYLQRYSKAQNFEGPWSHELSHAIQPQHLWKPGYHHRQPEKSSEYDPRGIETCFFLQNNKIIIKPHTWRFEVNLCKPLRTHWKMQGGGGGGLLPIMAFTGRLRPKGIPFSGFSRDSTHRSIQKGREICHLGLWKGPKG